MTAHKREDFARIEQSPASEKDREKHDILGTSETSERREEKKQPESALGRLVECAHCSEHGAEAERVAENIGADERGQGEPGYRQGERGDAETGNWSQLKLARE